MIYVAETDIDIDEIYKSCKNINAYITENFNDIDYHGISPNTTKSFAQYNLLLYPLPQFHELYEKIRSMFRGLVAEDTYVMQCWLNMYSKEDYLDWHYHWIEENTWHGYFCVKGNDTITSYKTPDGEINDVVNKNNQLVMSANGLHHRTYPGEERVTIAFDIVPSKIIDPFGLKNHWMPI